MFYFWVNDFLTVGNSSLQSLHTMRSKREQWNGRSTKKHYLCSEEEEK